VNNAFFLALRRMRAPIIGLIVIYAIAVIGLTLVPGVDADGQRTAPLSFFHAFYFVSYTATTIGFGEIPTAFSDAQRMWVTVCIYMTVVGWSYSVVTLIALFQDKGFQNTLTTNRFVRRVRHQTEPFYLICGCGETGSLIAHSFDHRGQSFVVIEKDELRVQELDLQDFKTDTPALAADASQPDILLQAGLKHPKCRGVLAVTNDEEANLAIAIAVRLLNPGIPVIARARSPSVVANMASFGTNHIINPFERFAERLSLAVAAPESFRLVELLTGLHGTPIPEPHQPPVGNWIMCGYGRFGHALASHLQPTGIHLTIIDPAATDADQTISGDGTEAKTLLQAGIETAVGIIAGSDNDVNNLSIAVTAHELKPELFVVARQNFAANKPLFDAYGADLMMVPSRIIALECIAILTTPLLAQFLVMQRQKDEAWSHALVKRLQQLCDGRRPTIWDIKLNASEALAAWKTLMRGTKFSLGQILLDGTDRERALATEPLLIKRDSKFFLLPSGDFPLMAGDHLLLASSHSTRRNLEFTLKNFNELDYILTGENHASSWLWRKFSGNAVRPPAETATPDLRSTAKTS
jgi:voltage-gated potassium channel